MATDLYKILYDIENDIKLSDPFAILFMNYGRLNLTSYASPLYLYNEDFLKINMFLYSLNITRLQIFTKNKLNTDYKSEILTKIMEQFLGFI